MTILQDTREKKAYHENVVNGLKAIGHKVVRTKLFVGDYTRVDDMTVCVDLKQNMQEVYSNVISDHERFIRECKRAQDSGIHLIILVEQGGISAVKDVAKWRNPRVDRWYKIHNGQIRGAYRGVQIPKQPPVSSQRLAQTMQTISERYGVEWRFCSPDKTVDVICDVLGLS